MKVDLAQPETSKAMSWYKFRIKLELLKQKSYVIQYEAPETGRAIWSYYSTSKKDAKAVLSTTLLGYAKCWKLYKRGPFKMPSRRILLTEIWWRLTVKRSK